MRRVMVAGAMAAALIFAALQGATAEAAKPAVPNCLGMDLKHLARAAAPLGQAIKEFGLTEGGLGEDVLAHLQGLEPGVTCPEGGFPSRGP